jgi:hypothetical protein
MHTEAKDHETKLTSLYTYTTHFFPGPCKRKRKEKTPIPFHWYPPFDFDLDPLVNKIVLDF